MTQRKQTFSRIREFAFYSQFFELEFREGEISGYGGEVSEKGGDRGSFEMGK